MAEFDDTTTCTVCFEHYQEKGKHVPRILPCFHTLCEKCISTLLKGTHTLECPECRKPHLATKKVKTFPQNKYILSTLQRISHQLGTEKCEIHNRELSLFCVESPLCNKPICTLCMINDHKNHQLKDLQQMKEEMSQEMTTGVKSLAGNLRNKREALLATKGLFDEKREICVNKIKEKKEDMVRKFDTMMAEATRKVTKAQDNIDKELVAIDAYLKQLNNINQNSTSYGYEDIRNIGELLGEIRRSVPETQTLGGIETLQYPEFTEMPDAGGGGRNLVSKRFEASFLEQLSRMCKVVFLFFVFFYSSNGKSAE